LNNETNNDVVNDVFDHIESLESELAAVKAELKGEAFPRGLLDQANQLRLERDSALARVRELEEAGKPSSPHSRSTTTASPRKLEWFEIHRLKQALGGGE
jgi:hypothetical protein